MNDQIQAQIQSVKSEMDDLPLIERAILARGVMCGLGLAGLLAQELGTPIGQTDDFQGLVQFAIKRMSPPRNRDPKLDEAHPLFDPFVEDFKELLRTSIADGLRITRERRQASISHQDLVNKYLTMVIAIANHKALDNAIRDIRILRSIIGGGYVDREVVKDEIELCHEKFPLEIAAVERFNEMSGRGSFTPKEIWNSIRCNMQIQSGSSDEVLWEIEARYR